MAVEPVSFYAKDRAAWRQWLASNHDKEQPVWLIYDKGKNSGLSYDGIVEEALCFGWVDSKGGTVSDTQTKLYITRRKPKSAWSKSNKERIKKLTEAGLMQPAGIKAVEIGKANGAWQQLEKSDNLELPTELIKLLKSNPQAEANFESFPPSSKRIILEWIYGAKREETKINRIQQTVELASKGIRAHQ